MKKCIKCSSEFETLYPKERSLCYNCLTTLNPDDKQQYYITKDGKKISLDLLETTVFPEDHEIGNRIGFAAYVTKVEVKQDRNDNDYHVVHVADNIMSQKLFIFQPRKGKITIPKVGKAYIFAGFIVKNKKWGEQHQIDNVIELKRK